MPTPTQSRLPTLQPHVVDGHGATTAEIMHRVSRKSAAAARRYQHATRDRDAVLAAAFSQMTQVAPVVLISEGSRAIRGVEAKRSEGNPPLRAPARGNKWSGRRSRR